ncbi:MAG: hypothetical protein P8Y42_22670 [Exilibacterium sp.]
MHTLIYDWGTRPDFLLRRLYPDARLVAAQPLLDASRIVSEARSDYKDTIVEGEKLWFFHLNLSATGKWLPGRGKIMASLKALGYRLVNEHIVDTRKSRVQRLNRDLGLPHVEVGKGDDPDLKVIVKTDYNYGGALESRLSHAEINSLDLKAPEGCQIRDFDKYYVCPLAEVSDEVWRDQRLVVERYIDNPSGLFYRFYRNGSRVVLSEVVNNAVVKKMLPGLPRRNWYYSLSEMGLTLQPSCPAHPNGSVFSSLTDNAVKICAALQLEFGAMDIVVDGVGRPYIIDINPTPGWGVEKQSGILDFLRGGFR